MAGHFLQELPSRNKSNFAKMEDRCFKKPDTDSESRPYICLEDKSTPQVIVTEKTNILLEFLHKQWDKKMQLNKRPQDKGVQERHSSDEDDVGGASASGSRKNDSTRSKTQPNQTSPTKKRRIN